VKYQNVILAIPPFIIRLIIKILGLIKQRAVASATVRQMCIAIYYTNITKVKPYYYQFLNGCNDNNTVKPAILKRYRTVLRTVPGTNEPFRYR